MIADLDAPRFAVREKAAQDLRRLAALFRPALERASTESRSLEVRRLRHLLEASSRPTPDPLRVLRAVEVLEVIGGDEAARTLQGMAGGFAGALLTQQAQAALARRRNK